jgi:hypothetical protein
MGKAKEEDQKYIIEISIGSKQFFNNFLLYLYACQQKL